jgi:hypothetical protein
MCDAVGVFWRGKVGGGGFRQPERGGITVRPSNGALQSSASLEEERSCNEVDVEAGVETVEQLSCGYEAEWGENG